MRTTQTVPEFGHIQDGTTWMGGPTHELQRQHIPGYMGHVHSLFAENVHGKNFARVTSECLNQRATVGIEVPKEQRYNTSYREEFGKPDTRKTQFITTAENMLNSMRKTEEAINRRNHEQYEKLPKSIQDVRPIDRVPVVGYMGHRPVFRHPIKSFNPPSKPEKVELPQIKVLDDMLTTGNLDENFVKDLTRKEVPVVGYNGFVKSIKSENMYGAPFRDLAGKSLYS